MQRYRGWTHLQESVRDGEHDRDPVLRLIVRVKSAVYVIRGKECCQRSLQKEQDVHEERSLRLREEEHQKVQRRSHVVGEYGEIASAEVLAEGITDGGLSVENILEPAEKIAQLVLSVLVDECLIREGGKPQNDVSEKNDQKGDQCGDRTCLKDRSSEGRNLLKFKR